jgi:hypothetical protein
MFLRGWRSRSASDLPQLDLQQAAKHDGGAIRGEVFDNSQAGGVLWLVGKQRLGDQVGVEHRGFGWLPSGCVEGEHAAWQRRPAARGYGSANPGRG